MEMVFAAGSVINISVLQDGVISMAVTSVNKPKRRRGPVKLPVSQRTSKDFHAPILSILADGGKSSAAIRAALGTNYNAEKDANVVSWALVELQNEGQRRGRGVSKTGPVVRLTDGTYALR